MLRKLEHWLCEEKEKHGLFSLEGRQLPRD